MKVPAQGPDGMTNWSGECTDDAPLGGREKGPHLRGLVEDRRTNVFLLVLMNGAVDVVDTKRSLVDGTTEFNESVRNLSRVRPVIAFATTIIDYFFVVVSQGDAGSVVIQCDLLLRLLLFLLGRRLRRWTLPIATFLGRRIGRGIRIR